MAAIVEPQGLMCFVLTLIFLSMTDSQLVNIALNKPTNMSSVVDNYGSSLAVDGNTTDVMCSQSDVSGDNGTWWWVDLTQDRVVRYITLFLSPESANTMNGTEVYVSNMSGVPREGLDSCHTVTSGENGAVVPDVTNITCDTRGRFVVILKRGNQDNSTVSRLELCEVQVYVCLNGSYGPNCSNSCGECSGGGCAPVSGVCQGGCRDGYTGDQCKSVCGSGQYSQGCSMTCGQCGGDGCDHVTGWCQGGCKDGYTGNTCNKSLVSATDTMSPVVAGVIGGVIMLMTLIVLIVLGCLIFCFCVANVPKLPTPTQPTHGRSTIRYSRSKDDPPPSRDTVPVAETEERNNHHYEQLDSPRYTSTQPVSREPILISPTIIVTPDPSEHTTYENSEPVPSERDRKTSSSPQAEYMAMGRGSVSVYEPMECSVDSDMVTLSAQHELDKSLGGNSYVSMREFLQDDHSNTYM